MSTRHATMQRAAAARRQAGAALVVGLILLLVLTLLAISGMTTASLELQMAGNAQYQKQAFEAADAGVEQAMAGGIFNTNTTIGDFDNPAAVEPVPERGSGRQTEDCVEPDDPTDAEQCEFFVHFDQNSGQTPVPGGGYSIGTGFEAYHFVIDSFGVAERGGAADHRQSFYVVGPGGT